MAVQKLAVLSLRWRNYEHHVDGDHHQGVFLKGQHAHGKVCRNADTLW